MTSQRDTHLGGLLQELPVREHGPGYWAAVMAAAEPELRRHRAGAADSEGADRPAAHDATPLLRRRKAMWMAAAAVAAAAVLAVVVLAGLPGADRGSVVLGPQPATAAEAIRYALGALDDAQGLEGTLYIGKVRDGAFSAGDKVTFLCARNGSYRITTKTLGKDALLPLPGYVETVAYDARTRVAQGSFDYGEQGFRSEVTAQDPATGQDVITTTITRYVFTETHDVAPGPPDARVFVGSGEFPIWQVRAYLRTMLGDPHIRFTTGELNGRAVWTLRAEAFSAGPAEAAAKGRSVTVIIDADTRLPLRVGGFRGRYELRVDSAALTQAPPASEFTLEKPPAEETQEQSAPSLIDESMRFPALPLSDPAAMTKAVDGIPAFPAWLPRGFELQEGASQAHGSVSLPRSLGGGSIPGTIVSLAYRRGFDAAYVSVRPEPRLTGVSTIGPSGEGEPEIRVDTSDPFIGDVSPWDRAQWRRHTTDVRLTAGAFEGATAHVIVDPGYWPHLWVKKDGWVATVAGDLTREEMVRIAESLGPWSGQAAE